MTLSARTSRPARLVFVAGLALPWALGHAPIFDGDPPPPEPTTASSPDASHTPEGTAHETPSPTEPTATTSNPTPSETLEQPTETVEVTLTETSSSPSETPTPTSTDTETAEATLTPSETPSETPTLTPVPTAPATPYPPLAVLINEVAWAGTLASSSDEWIELYNTTASPVDLTGWRLTDNGDIRVSLAGTLPAYGLFLLERTDDTTIADIVANQIYTGSLNNAGESLYLLDPTGTLVDSANITGGGWPAGDALTRASMERLGGEDSPGSWTTFSGLAGTGHDAAGHPIAGTPRAANSPFAATATPTASPPPVPALTVLINEVAWAGTWASSSDEWIELLNPGTSAVDLSGWRLTDGGDVNIALGDLLPAGSFYLLERTDDLTVADIAADQMYTGGLNNDGETLRLLDPTGALIDSANGDGGGWSAGSGSSYASMERRGGDDRSGNWGTFTGYYGTGHDADGNPIVGTPRATNSLFFPTPAPTWIPGRIVINEVLIRPHYDWEGTGGVNSNDEFIELYNLGPFPVYLRGFLLDDIPDGGSAPYTIPGFTLGPGTYRAFFHTRTHIALNDSGDTIRLLDPDGNVLDEITYLRVRAYNLSYGRLPDGSSRLRYGLWPTPGEANILFVEPTPITILSPDCPQGGLPQPRLPRLARHPALARWMASLGLAVCQ